MREVPKAVPTHDLLAVAHHTLARRIDQTLAESGFPDLTLSLASNVLRFVDAGGRRVSEIADLAPVSKQAVSRQVDVLARAGYVVVTVDPADARGRVVRLTGRGHRAHRAIMTIFTTVEETLTDALGGPRLEQLRETLTTIADDLRHRDDARVLRPSPGGADERGDAVERLVAQEGEIE